MCTQLHARLSLLPGQTSQNILDGRLDASQTPCGHGVGRRIFWLCRELNSDTSPTDSPARSFFITLTELFSELI